MKIYPPKSWMKGIGMERSRRGARRLVEIPVDLIPIHRVWPPGSGDMATKLRRAGVRRNAVATGGEGWQRVGDEAVEY